MELRTKETANLVKKIRIQKKQRRNPGNIFGELFVQWHSTKIRTRSEKGVLSPSEQKAARGEDSNG